MAGVYSSSYCPLRTDQIKAIKKAVATTKLIPMSKKSALIEGFKAQQMYFR
jgi:hypothetical protein